MREGLFETFYERNGSGSKPKDCCLATITVVCCEGFLDVYLGAVGV